MCVRVCACGVGVDGGKKTATEVSPAVGVEKKEKRGCNFEEYRGVKNNVKESRAAGGVEAGR